MARELGKKNQEYDYDVIIIGGGISGIDAAYHIQKECPWATYKILERRENIGGTWDLFKYPGIRSDADMYTFGFSWKIWNTTEPIAGGDKIMKYLHSAVKEQGIDKHIEFGCDVDTANYSSSDKKWHLILKDGRKIACGFLFGCTGYYQYDNPHTPIWPGQEDFKGKFIHPQHWKKGEHDDAIKNKKVVIIGSGATAITILPNVVDQVDHVTLVQRTPTYTLCKPKETPGAKFFLGYFPSWLGGFLIRWWSIFFEFIIFQFCSRFPDVATATVRKLMYKPVQKTMTKNEFDKHFTPPYRVWEQRLCISPDGDFFQALNTGKAGIVTGHIKTFTKNGIEMEDGTFVEADVVITATGLTLQKNMPFSTIKASIDDKPYVAKNHYLWRQIMLSDLPNFAFTIGYTNASWTLRAGIVSSWVVALLNYMRKNGISEVKPVADKDVKDGHLDNVLTSSYFGRAREFLPKHGNCYPWNEAYGENGVYVKDYLDFWWQQTFGIYPCLQFTPQTQTEGRDETQKPLLVAKTKSSKTKSAPSYFNTVYHNVLSKFLTIKTL